MKKKLVILLACTILGTALSGCAGKNDDVAKAGTLTVGVRDSTPGFGYRNTESGIYSGLEVDIAKELADAMNYDIEFVSVNHETRTKYLDDGTVDCVIATFTPTDERKKKYDFSDAYHVGTVKVMTMSSSCIGSVEELKGLKIGVVEDTNAAITLVNYMADKGIIPAVDQSSFSVASFNGGVSFKEYNSYDELNYGLETGEVDAVVGDYALLFEYRDDEHTELPDVLEKQDYAVATLKGSSLSSTIDEHIKQWNEDGTIAEIENKHLSESD